MTREILLRVYLPVEYEYSSSKNNGPTILNDSIEMTLNSFDEILVVYGDSINSGSKKIIICALGAQI
jgi:hypothetical protein